MKGAAEDTEALTAVARGADAIVVSITGAMKDATFMQRTLPGIIEAAKRAAVSRIVRVSAFGAGDTAAKASGFARAIYRTVLAKFFHGKAAADKLLQSSDLGWGIVYPVNLKDAPALPEGAVVKPLAQVAKVSGLPTLPFDNAATALLEIVESDAATGQRLLVTTPKGWKSA